MDHMTLCRITQCEAEHLMLAPRMAGGWIAVEPGCREAVLMALGEGHADYIALLPSTWPIATHRPVSAAQAELIAATMERVARSVGEVAPARMAQRIRELLADAAEVQS